jgi:glycine hydroxymethyltransferase
LDEVGLTTNKNMIFNDSRKALDPSGIRIGTPAITTRGFGKKESKKLANLIIKVLKNYQDNKTKKEARREIKKLTGKFKL